LERWLVIFTAALVLVGLLQFGVFFWQVKWMRRNVEIAEKSADAARQSANAASATVALMGKTTRKELRARVFVASARRTSPAGPGSFCVEISIKNFGKIPAYDCTYLIEMILAPNPNVTFPNLHKKGQEPVIVLPPDGEITIAKVLHTGTFQHVQDTQVADGSYAVFIYGEIRYRDGFARDRVSKFRMRCCGLDYAPGRFSFCESGNEAT